MPTPGLGRRLIPSLPSSNEPRCHPLRWFGRSFRLRIIGDKWLRALRFRADVHEDVPDALSEAGSSCVPDAAKRGSRQNRDSIRWKLSTDRLVHSGSGAFEKLHWYALRWKIETFHRIRRFGCRPEDLKPRTTEC